jgi:hypothetical protein
MQRARAADSGKFALESSAGAMRANGGVARRQFVALREADQRLLFEIYFAKNFRVRRLQRRQHMCDATADKCPRRRIRRGHARNFEVGRPLVDYFVLSSATAVVVDHRIPEHAIEPRDGRIVFAQTARALQRAHVRGLQDVLGERRVGDAALDEGEEAGAAVEQRLYCRINHKSKRGKRERRTAPTALARAARADRAIAFRAAGAGAFHRHCGTPFDSRSRRS